MLIVSLRTSYQGELPFMSLFPRYYTSRMITNISQIFLNNFVSIFVRANADSHCFKISTFRGGITECSDLRFVIINFLNVLYFK